jgi:hypothetical protein
MASTFDRHRQHEIVAHLTRMQALRKCLNPKTSDTDARKLMNLLADVSCAQQAWAPAKSERRW